jgi:hypothetical protein
VLTHRIEKNIALPGGSMNPTRFLILVSILLVPGLSFGESAPEPITKSITTFFKILQESPVEKAYDSILEGSPIASKSQDVQNLINQTKNGFSLYGPFRSFEFISGSYAGTSIIRVSYITKNDRFPIRWQFTYYKPEQTWNLIHIEFDDKIGSLFE